MTWLYVGLGAGLGAVLRYLAGHLLDGELPHGTIAVNLVGSFLLGLFSAMSLSGTTLAFCGTGFCGALTTYSSFAVQTHDRGPLLGSFNVAVTVVPALVLCAAGFYLGAG